jgi:DNA-binding response OmpR family regulator
MEQLDPQVVLVVEDDPFLVKAYEFMFAEAGIHLRIARDGAEALQLMDGPAPKLILLDLMLPGISGFEVMEALQKHGSWKTVPVMIVSNLEQSSDIARGKALGAIDYMVKAKTDITALVDKVKRFLASQQTIART